MKTAVVTGANGFIGSHIIYRLLQRGWRVHALGRSRGSNRWNDRVISALSEVGSADSSRGELQCHEVDLNAPDVKLDFVFNRDDSPAETTLFHVAGDTKFTPSDPQLQRLVNVQGSANVINALKRKIATAVHVSTAYVAGNRKGLIQERELDCGQGFNNPYEHSKFDAENMLMELCQEHDIPLVIVRPSIITNDRQSGRASTFTHLNALIEVISRLQEHYGIADGEVVSTTVRLMADAEAKPNLAPVDSIIPPLLEIAESPAAAGKTFHLCHPRPQANSELVDLICEVIKIKGKLALEYRENIPRPMSRTEEMIARSLKPYAPYLNSRCEFDVNESRSVVPDYDNYFTELNVPYIRKIVEVQRDKKNDAADWRAAADVSQIPRVPKSFILK